MIHAYSLTRSILELIQNNPGITRGDILKNLPTNTLPQSVSSIMRHLSAAKAIENRGGIGLAASWYAVVEENVEAPYLVIAGELMDEMAEIHHSRREEYLAKRLQEIFGE